MKSLKLLLKGCTFLILIFPGVVFATVRLPHIFGNNMVLQRNQPIPVWGWADAGELVTVHFNKQVKKVKADESGKWNVVLNQNKAGGPFELIVAGTNKVVISNVLIGEVWVCSGQSNMEWVVQNSANADKEMQEAGNSQIRHFKVPVALALKEADDITGGEWKEASPKTVGQFTAVGYFFAKALYQQLKVPIGLVNASCGGTHIETWTSLDAFRNNCQFKDMTAAIPTTSIDELKKQRKEELIKAILSLQSDFDSNARRSWNEVQVDDSHWPHMIMPGYWEQQPPLEILDGIIWFRKSFSLPDADAGKEAVIDLGLIDETDETYVNGEKVGLTKNRWNEPRHYTIPAGLLKPGKNVIAVKVEDTNGGGGMIGEASSMKITIGNQIIQSLSGDWQYRVVSIIDNHFGIFPNSYPTLLYNAMIQPLIPFAIKGIIWYQGESNTTRAYQYRTAFPMMINDWRNKWKQGSFPFIYAQLASFNTSEDASKGSSWAELRESQAMALKVPNTGMAVTTDIGDAHDIHPRNKQDVGKRLAAIALNNTYNIPVAFSGPVYKGMTIAGGKARIRFDSGSGLLIKDRYGYLKGFQVAGADQQFYYARAVLEDNVVVLSCDKVQIPVAVRFAWSDNPEDANLFNKDGLPAVPFRTDHWKEVTIDEKYSIGQ